MTARDTNASESSHARANLKCSFHVTDNVGVSTTGRIMGLRLEQQDLFNNNNKKTRADRIDLKEKELEIKQKELELDVKERLENWKDMN
nr:15300_t:CDS:2 [Entrophospora candida]